MEVLQFMLLQYEQFMYVVVAYISLFYAVSLLDLFKGIKFINDYHYLIGFDYLFGHQT